MRQFEKQRLVEKELDAFKKSLPEYADAPLMVRLATERIREKLFDPELSIEQLQNHLGTTDSTLSVRFRQYHGHTPKRYARHLRMEAAKKLLRHDQLTATTVALAVGYEHYRSFTRAFKKHTERSPSAFRRRAEETGD